MRGWGHTECKSLSLLPTRPPLRVVSAILFLSSWLLTLVWVQAKESAFGRLHLPQVIRSLTPIFHTVTSQDLSGDHYPLRELDLSRVCKDTLALGCLDAAVCVTGGGKAKVPPHLPAPPKGGIALEYMSIVYCGAWELLGVG